MKDRISLTLEGVGSGLFWILGGFTLLVLTAPFFWFGEALSDLRWHMGFVALLPALPGAFFLPRRRLTFVALAAMGVLNILPGLRVFVPPSDEHFPSGAELTLLEVHWGHEPTAALEEFVAKRPSELIFVTGLDEVGRASLKERLTDWPYVEVWPPILLDRAGEAAPLEEDTTMLFSKLPLDDFAVTGFSSGACIFDTTLALGDLPVTLRGAVLPPPGPGEIGAARAALLEELETREWPTRGILLADLASADTTPAYGELLDATNYTDSRRGFGRMATIRASLFGLEMPALWVPSEYLLHGGEVETLERKTERLFAAERDLIGLVDDPDAPERWPQLTHLRIKGLAP
jgi:hypothetical protein